MNIHKVILKSNRIVFNNQSKNYFFNFAKVSPISNTIILNKKCNNLFVNQYPNMNLTNSVNSRYQSSESKSKTEINTNIEQNDKEKLEIKVTEQPLSRAQKLKKAVAEYGSTVIVFHITISLASLGICYTLVSAGLDVSKVFTTLGMENWVSESQLASNAGTFAVAYAIHKVFAPVRISITLGAVPFIVKYLRNVGFLKK